MATRLFSLSYSMKKIFLLLTLLCLSLSARAHDAEVDGIFYNLDAANKTATVSFKGDYYDWYDNEYSGDVVIPETVIYNGITYSVTSLGEWCLADCSSLTSITIPNSVTSLGNYCFESCSSLTSINIPNSVTTLGYGCFEYCRSLTSITIPNSVMSIGEACFSYCSNLERMVVDAANPVFDSREDCNAIIHTSTNELVAGCKNSQIPNSVTSLGYYCFFGCSSLTSITIPNSVTSLRDYCFGGCSSLTSITIPNSVTSVGENCFGWCSSLTSITIPNSVTSLGDECFEGCSSLTSITMLPSTPPSTGEYIFNYTPLETVYVVDEDAKTAYQAQAPWSAYEIVVMPTGIEEMETDKTAPTIVGYYDLNGRQVSSKQRGPIIIRYSDGTSRRVIMK